MEEHYIRYYTTAARYDHCRGAVPAWWAADGNGSLNREDAVMAEFCDSEPKADGAPAGPVERSEDDFDRAAARTAARKNFEDVWPRWQQYSKTINWRKVFPDAKALKNLPVNRILDEIEHLLHLPVLQHYKVLVDKQCYGMMPYIGIQVLGRDLSESFSEGVNSAAGDVVADRPRLDDTQIETETILKKNAKVKSAWEVEFLEMYAQLAKETEAVLNAQLQ